MRYALVAAIDFNTFRSLNDMRMRLQAGQTRDGRTIRPLVGGKAHASRIR